MPVYNPSTKPTAVVTNALINEARQQALASLNDTNPRLTALGWAYRQRLLHGKG